MNKNNEWVHHDFNEVSLDLLLVFHDHNVSLKNMLTDD